MRLTSFQLNTLMVLALLSIAATRPGVPPAVPEPETLTAIRVDVQPGLETVVTRAEPFHPSPVTIGQAAGYSPPDFTTFRDVGEKKRAFYDYLLPMVHEANEEVVRERAWLEALAHAMVAGYEPTDSELDELAQIERRYAIRRPADSLVARIAELLERVDVVPASLIIAQAAKESGWGTSRFARQGNNFFGIWCFYEGCGMKPLHRAEGRNHEVAMFDTVEQGVRYYIRTINSHVAYEELRQMRAEAQRDNEVLPGTVLANGLVRYSERGLAYVREIQSMIRYNGLQRFTRPYSA